MHGTDKAETTQYWTMTDRQINGEIKNSWKELEIISVCQKSESEAKATRGSRNAHIS